MSIFVAGVEIKRPTKHVEAAIRVISGRGFNSPRLQVVFLQGVAMTRDALRPLQGAVFSVGRVDLSVNGQLPEAGAGYRAGSATLGSRRTARSEDR